MMSCKSLVRLTLAAILLVVFASALHAQYRASIQGVVTDPEGAIIPGAKATLTNLETGKSQDATSSSEGIYNFGALPPSRFKLEVSKEGFKTKILDNVAIIAEQVNAINVELEVGTATETVTVNAEETPLIDTETAQISGTITGKEIETMPVFGRDIFQTVQLAPGFFGDGARNGSGDTNSIPGNQGPGGSGASTGVYATENRTQVTGAGGRTDANGVSVDGVSINSVSWNGAAIVTPNPDSVKLTKAVANDYDAEYGRNSGGKIQVVTQNGTNQFHGTAYFKMDRPGLNAYQNWSGSAGLPTVPQRNNSRFNDWGGSIGGPILKNKLFFFFAYDTIRNSSTTTGTGWYETPALLKSAPAGSLASRYGSFAPELATSYSSVIDQTCASIGLVQGTNCNMIPGQGLDIGRPLIPSLFPLGTNDPSFKNNLTPGLGGDGTGSPSNLDGVADIFFVNATGPNNQTNQQYMGRMDFNPTNKDLLAFTIYWVPVTQTTVNGGLARPANLFHHDAINQAMTLLWNRTWTSSLLNEFRVNAAGWRWNELESNPQAALGLPQTMYIGDPNNGNRIGTLSSGCSNCSNGLTGLGTAAGSVFNQWTYSYKDVVTKVKGAHTMKFGGEITNFHFVQEAPWSARPNWGFANYWDFLNDATVATSKNPALAGINAETGTFNPLTGVPTDVRKDSRVTWWGFFFQDSWKFRPNLTLTAGLRWDYFGSPYFLHNLLSSVDLGSGNNVLTGLNMRIGGSLYTPPKGNFSPQLGFAWSPNSVFGKEMGGRLVIRGGFGMAYNGQEQAITLNGWPNVPFTIGSTNLAGSNVVYNFPSNPQQFAPYPANPNTIVTFNSANLPATGLPVGVTGFPSYYPTAYAYRYSLVAQYDLGRNWVATLGYQGTNSHHLTRQYNLNSIYGAQGIPLNPAVNDVDWYAQDGNSHFNAFLAEINHQFSNQFQIAGSYRWSSSVDNASGPYTVSYYQWNSAANYGPSDFNVGSSLKIYGIYSPNWFASGSWERSLLGGWSFSGIMNYHSGFPYTPVFNAGTCNIIYASGNCVNGTNGQLIPAQYLGGAVNSHVNGTYLAQGGQFPKGGTAYFVMPTVTPCTLPFPQVCGGAPQAPGMGRNGFTGPGYFDLDMTMTKAFALPRIPGIGEGSQLQVQMSAFNLFNNLNLTNLDTVITDPHFGQAQGALGARTAEVQFKFVF
jgi:hypothetical protein